MPPRTEIRQEFYVLPGGACGQREPAFDVLIQPGTAGGAIAPETAHDAIAPSRVELLKNPWISPGIAFQQSFRINESNPARISGEFAERRGPLAINIVKTRRLNRKHLQHGLRLGNFCRAGNR